VAAGNLPLLDAVKPEAELIRALVAWGVPSAAIEIAGASRNTYENAIEIKGMRRKSRFKSALLVTSAVHMSRVMAVFQRAGLPVIASTADVLVVERSQRNLLSWLPDASALAMTTFAVREWLGYWAYRARGYL